jgi:hypothetical protein
VEKNGARGTWLFETWYSLMERTFFLGQNQSAAYGIQHLQDSPQPISKRRKPQWQMHLMLKGV